jgi:hypothetical protein
MATNYYDITILQGADYSLELTVEDAIGDPIDITGATILSQIRTSWDAPIIASFSTLITSGVNGQFNLYLSGANSQAINPPINAKYDVLITLLDGTRMRVLEGNCFIKLAISHA